MIPLDSQVCGDMRTIRAEQLAALMGEKVRKVFFVILHTRLFVDLHGISGMY